MNDFQPKPKTTKKTARRRPAPRALQMPQSAFAFTREQFPVRSYGILSSVLNWFRARRAQASQTGRLRVTETIQLGDKRFVSVIHVDGHRYLIGGSSSSVALLTQLDAPESSFNETLRRAGTKRKSPASSRTRQAA